MLDMEPHARCWASVSLSWQENVGFLTGHPRFHVLWGNNDNNLFCFCSSPEIYRHLKTWARGQGEQPQLRCRLCPGEIGHHSTQIWVFGREKRGHPSVTKGRTPQEWRIPNTFHILLPLQGLALCASRGTNFISHGQIPEVE